MKKVIKIDTWQFIDIMSLLERIYKVFLNIEKNMYFKNTKSIPDTEKNIMQMKLPCTYLYKGSSNIDIRLKSFVEDTIEIYSSYNEKMTTVSSYYEFKKFMDDLLAGKYA